MPMISKKLLCKRLSSAVGRDLTNDFPWLFRYFCEKTHRQDLRTTKQLSEQDVIAFSQFCGYDLRFPIPLPLLAKL